MDHEKVASCCLAVLIYCRKAELLNLLSIQMAVSSMPALAVVAAAPIRKLWSPICDPGSSTATVVSCFHF